MVSARADDEYRISISPARKRVEQAWLVARMQPIDGSSRTYSTPRSLTDLRSESDALGFAPESVDADAQGSVVRRGFKNSRRRRIHRYASAMALSDP